MVDVSSILTRAADKCGFVRSRWVEKDVPSNLSNVSTMLFFGDIRSSFILSSMLLKRYREQIKGSKYFIVCTWPGYENLFPYVDEVWTVRDESILKKFATSACNFSNESELGVHFRRELNYWLEDVVGSEVFLPFYDNGIKEDFWAKFKHVRRYLISVPSSGILGTDFNRQLITQGAKVLLYPAENIRSWRQGRLEYLKCPKDFWIQLAESLMAAKITPIIYQNFATYDLSMELSNRCMYTAEKDVAKVFGIMRTVGCVLDIFSGISRWAIGARTPFVALDERMRHSGQREHEIDDLLADKTLPRHYIFSFPIIAHEGNSVNWKNNYFDVIMAALVPFLAELDREKWPSPLEREEIVLYENVRQRRTSKMGTRLLKVNRDLRNTTWQ